LNSLDGPFNQIQAVRSFLSKAGDWRHFNTFIAQIKSIDSASLTRIAEKYLDPETMITVLVGTKSN